MAEQRQETAWVKASWGQVAVLLVLLARPPSRARPLSSSSSSSSSGQLYDTRQLLDRERGMKAEVEARQSMTMTQLSQSGDKGKLLELEIADLKKQLDLEK